jgi:small subunit ribosomal protein S19
MSFFKKDYKKKLYVLKPLKKSKEIKIFKASFFISSNFLGKNVLVYNGKEFIPLLIKNEMIGFRFGDFITTRKGFSVPKNKKKK